MPKRILVTGGAGFIGSHLIDKLLSEGHKTLCVDDFNDFYDPQIKKTNIKNHLKNSNYLLAELDIRNKEKIDTIFNSFNPDIVIHLAARAGVRPSLRDPFLYESTNVLGTLNLLDASVKAGVKKFIFASSSSVYGKNNKIPFTEYDAILQPVSPYAATKIAGEALCHAYSHLYGLNVVSLRFFTVYGPRQRPDLAIHKFARLMLESQPIPVFGDGSTSRDYTNIDDIIQGVRSAIDYQGSKYEVFNLGNNQTVSLKELILILEDVLGIKAKINWLPEQPGDVQITYANIEKAKHMLGYNPKTNIQSGIKSFIDWLINFYKK